MNNEEIGERNLNAEEKAALLAEIAQRVSVCQNCVLHHSRKKSVPGTGPADAQIMFIGEGPGFHENEQGLPFVGAAGKLLDDLLAGIGMHRKDVFITNVVKCRPPGNRDPEPDELQACNAYLDRQIEILNPPVIVTLGRFSMAKFFTNAKISQVHGRPKPVDGRMIVPMFHPAAALHQGSLKPLLEQDFKRLPEFITNAAKISKPAVQPAHIQQSSLFDSMANPESTSDESPAQKPASKPKQLSLF